MSTPSKVILPRDGVTMPEIRFNSVVLPQPDGPSSAYAPPCRHVMVTGFSAKVSGSAWLPL
jgi:hypothetical protein